MYKNDFPLLARNPKIHYLDSAATSQRPQVVLDGLQKYFTDANGNAGRGSHSLAIASSLLVEETRKKVTEFIGAKNPDDIVFTKNCTESLNILAYCYALPFLQKDDEILIPVSNHHANLVTWQYAAEKTGAKLRFVYLQKDGSIDMQDFSAKLNERTKIVALSAVVNATGAVNPVQEVVRKAHDVGAIAIVDSAQAIMHAPQNVSELDCDFMVFSGHKFFSAFGVGVLYGKAALLKKMPPFLYGGEMIEYVSEEKSEYKEAPHKYEGGTLDSAAIVSLKYAIEYIQKIGYQNIAAVIGEVYRYALSEFKKLDFIETYHMQEKNNAGIIAFNVKDVHSHDTAYILNEYGVMVRSGHHCTQPLMNYLGINSCCRASISIYNTREDIDVMVEALKKVQQVFNS
ncbi:SufS family cysteine desulfurase [Treponema phagedenis]|uniref:Cysteine desulfurase n=1 Tax=Treponema phagedenis TaxID=162 RepID=A0AAE6M9D0_TREPH|nr:SufS family cysteine desulfurase [Treponema phagedenis]NVP23856.1 SufS family cysteine desulfurase [Treponema phagedenis]QEJ96350.1 SufS family cysteine desulfurase [Treponema phagedenis]QEJ99509.1 SufS family cysteine desulfurase [Treponema phagedenis]QEK02148.1 SufS family cysteine desulfurase [Treponema phagedenis]QEK05080.1 SufS family cysteine desulfurase [Treponema phagedenis]